VADTGAKRGLTDAEPGCITGHFRCSHPACRHGAACDVLLSLLWHQTFVLWRRPLGQTALRRNPSEILRGSCFFEERHFPVAFLRGEQRAVCMVAWQQAESHRGTALPAVCAPESKTQLRQTGLLSLWCSVSHERHFA